MPMQYLKNAKAVYKALLLIMAIVIIAFVAIALSDLMNNRVRMSAFNHLCRNERTRLLLDTWSITPKAALQSRPQSQTVFGTIEPRPRWTREIVGIELIVARLAGVDSDDSDLEALSHFEELEYLELVNARVTDSALDRLREAIPNCQIVKIMTEPNALGHAAAQRP